jgi:AcrR family transcriptional regulator
MSPTQKVPKRVRTRRRLVDAGLEVFAELGDAFTVLDVVRRAGVSNGTYYNYFDDLEQLTEAFVAKILTGIAEEVSQQDLADPAERFVIGTLGLMQQMRAQPLWASAILRLSIRPHVMEGLLAPVRADLEAGRATGRFGPHADEVGFEVAAGLYFVMLRRVAHGGQLDDAYLIANVERLLLHFGMPADEVASLLGRVAPTVLKPPEPPS